MTDSSKTEASNADQQADMAEDWALAMEEQGAAEQTENAAAATDEAAAADDWEQALAEQGAADETGAADEAEPEPEPETETETETETEPEPETEADAEAQAAPEAGFESQSGAAPAAEPEAGAEADAAGAPAVRAGNGAAADDDKIFQPLENGAGANTPRDLDMIMDIPVTLSVQLGETRLTIRELLDLAQGSVIELDGLAGEPMDIQINGYLIAQGEVVVVDDKYGIRITDIITPAERIPKLSR